MIITNNDKDIEEENYLLGSALPSVIMRNGLFIFVLVCVAATIDFVVDEVVVVL
jgi:hypothetical protein